MALMISLQVANALKGSSQDGIHFICCQMTMLPNPECGADCPPWISTGCQIWPCRGRPDWPGAPWAQRWGSPGPYSAIYHRKGSGRTTYGPAAPQNEALIPVLLQQSEEVYDLGVLLFMSFIIVPRVYISVGFTFWIIVMRLVASNIFP